MTQLPLFEDLELPPRPAIEPAPQTVIDRVLTKYKVFNASNVGDGYAERLANTLAHIDRHHDRIDAALQYTDGTHTHDQLVAMVVSGRVSFWDLGDSFMMTEIIPYPSATHFHIFLAGGKLGTLVNMHPDVVKLAQALQCDKITLAGRPGWEKALKGHGWTPHVVTLSKDI